MVRVLLLSFSFKKLKRRKKRRVPKRVRDHPEGGIVVEGSQILSVETIGEAAGVVWSHLNDHGRMTITALHKAIPLPDRLVDAAVGWLAREQKIAFETEGRTTYLFLL